MILSRFGSKRKKSRRATAAVELAVLLPVLIFWSMAGVDFARVVYVQVILQNFAATASFMNSIPRPAIRCRQGGPAWRLRWSLMKEAA